MLNYLRQKFARLTNAELMRNSLTLLVGSGGAKLIGLASIPAITRIYTPADYGIVAVFTSTVLLLTPLATFRYSVALPLPRSGKLAMSLLAVCVVSCVFFLVVVSTLFWAFDRSIFGVLVPEELNEYKWFVVATVLLAASYEIMIMWATRQEDFHLIARSQVSQTMVGVALKLTLGLVGLKPLGLVIGQMAQQGSGVLLVASRFRHFDVRLASRLRMIAAARRYRKFPAYRLPSQLLLAAASQAPVLVFARFYGSSEAGQLGLAITAIGIPMALVAQTVSNAFYGKISRLGKTRVVEIAMASNSLVKGLGLVAVTPTLVLALFGPSIFEMFFGSEWGTSGEYARALVVVSAAQIMAAPMMHLYSVFERHREFLKININRCILLAIVFGGCIFFEVSAWRMIVIYSLSMTAFYASVMRDSLRHLKVEVERAA